MIIYNITPYRVMESEGVKIRKINYKKITDKDVDIDFYDNLIDSKKADKIFKEIDDFFPQKPNKRINQTYGNDGLTYEVKFKDNTVYRRAMPWKPILLELKKLVEGVTKEKFTVCVVQRYPNGNIGIGSHKDKEMKFGTKIAGLSLGQCRTLSMSRYDKVHTIELPSGSLYVFNPPTNDFWAHSIVKDEKKKGVRLSLTFRNY